MGIIRDNIEIPGGVAHVLNRGVNRQDRPALRLDSKVIAMSSNAERMELSAARIRRSREVAVNDVGEV